MIDAGGMMETVMTVFSVYIQCSLTASACVDGRRACFVCFLSRSSSSSVRGASFVSSPRFFPPHMPRAVERLKSVLRAPQIVRSCLYRPFPASRLFFHHLLLLFLLVSGPRCISTSAVDLHLEICFTPSSVSLYCVFQ